MSASQWPYRRGIAVRKIDAAVRQANIVDDGSQFALAESPANVVFHAVANCRSVFDPGSGRSPHVQLEFAAIDAGKEILPNQGSKQRNATQAKQEADSRKCGRCSMQRLQQSVVAVPQLSNPCSNFMLHPHKRIARLFGRRPALFFALRPADTWPWWAPASARAGRTPSSRTHSFGERYKQIARHTGKEKHGHEHDADGQGGYERREWRSATHHPEWPERFLCPGSCCD
jgi:hypothetical protein